MNKAGLNKAIGMVVFLLNLIVSLYPQSFAAKSYTVSDGLANPTVMWITQDRRGLMWFATLKGITSYDGFSWVNYSQLDGLTGSEYRAVHSDSAGNVWALPKELADGIFRFNAGRWFHHKGPAGMEDMSAKVTATTILESDDGVQLGFGTLEKGFYIYSSNRNQWSHIPGNLEPTSRTGISGSIFSAESFDGAFYLGGSNGLYRVDHLDTDTPVKINIDTPSTEIYAIARETKTVAQQPEQCTPRLWLVGKEWIGYYCLKSKEYKTLYKGKLPGMSELSHYRRMRIIPDRFGGLWVGSWFALFSIDFNGNIKVMATPNSSLEEGAAAFFLDRESNLWIGTFRGVTKIVSFRFENYTQANGLYDDEVTAVCQFENGSMVFGHNGGISFLEQGRVDYIKIGGQKNPIIHDIRILDMCRDHRGNIWAAVSRMGILRISPSRRLTWFLDVPQPGKGRRRYHSTVFADKKGGIWASSNNLVLKYRNGRFIAVNKNADPDNPHTITDNIRRFFGNFRERSNNYIYVATNTHGIYRLNIDDNSIKKLLGFEKNKRKMIYAIYPDSPEQLMVGSDEGLYILRDGQLERFMEQWFLLGHPVYFITEDREQNLWFGLNDGVIRWDGSYARHYRRQNGLVGNETNRAAGYSDSSGRMWIGTDKGVSCYYTERDITPMVPPKLELIYLDATGKQFTLDKDVHVEYHRNDLTIYYRGIAFADEKNVRYNYKLDGHDKRWITDYRSTGNYVRYPNLKPGTYRFNIQAVNSNGIESDIISSGEIHIGYPFYQAWWFYFLLFFAFLVFVFLIGTVISKRRYAYQLEEQFRRRTRQLELSERELRNIFNTAHDAIIIFGPENEIVFDVNKRACDMYGFTRPEFIGMSLETITKDVERGKSKVDITMRDGGFYNFDTVQFRKNGTEMILEVNASVINYRGRPAILSLNRDISERKQVEDKIKRSLEEKVILLKEIHHRVKNNLQIISSLLDLQADSVDNPEVYRVFQDSKNRIRSMALVHENLYQSADMARIDAAEYVQSVVDYFIGTYGSLENRVSFDTQLQCIQLDMDTAIPVGLILTELLSNALKHAFPNAGKGRLAIFFHQQSNDSAILTVSDNGVGLPENVQPGNSNSLGLMLVNLLTKQINGNISVNRDNGTTFKLTLPYKAGKNKDNTNTSEEDTGEPNEPEEKR